MAEKPNKIDQLIEEYKKREAKNIELERQREIKRMELAKKEWEKQLQEQRVFIWRALGDLFEENLHESISLWRRGEENNLKVVFKGHCPIYARETPDSRIEYWYNTQVNGKINGGGNCWDLGEALYRSKKE